MKNYDKLKVEIEANQQKMVEAKKERKSQCVEGEVK